MREESTTPDLVELTRSAFKAFGGGDLDALTGISGPEALWVSVGLGTSFEGAAAIRDFLEDWRGRYEDYEIDVQEIVELGNGVVFVKSSHSGRLVGSRDRVRMPREIATHTVVWEQGEITRIVSSGDTPKARAAAERLAEERA